MNGTYLKISSSLSFSLFSLSSSAAVGIMGGINGGAGSGLNPSGKSHCVWPVAVKQ